MAGLSPGLAVTPVLVPYHTLELGAQQPRCTVTLGDAQGAS